MKTKIAIEFTKDYYDTIEQNDEPYECIKHTIKTLEEHLYDENTITYFDDYWLNSNYDFISLEDTEENNKKIIKVIKEFLGNWVKVFQVYYW